MTTTDIEKIKQEFLKAENVTGDIYDAAAIKNSIADWWLDRFSHLLASRDKEILEGVEGMKKGVPSKKWGDSSRYKGYNHALSDVKQHILASKK